MRRVKEQHAQRLIGKRPHRCPEITQQFGIVGVDAATAQLFAHGHIISSGIKVLVLAVITGIGVTLFDRFMQAGLGPEPDIEQVMAIALGALTLLGLGIFGPSIANGIVAGGPQLGAGAAAGTAVAAGATLAAGAAGATLATGAAAAAARGTAAAGARGAGSASTAYAAGAAGKSGAKAIGGGLANVARTAASGAASPVRSMAERVRANFASGRDGPTDSAAPAQAASAPPAWAAAMRRRQTMTHGATIGAQTLKSGDSHGAGSAPNISEKD